MTLNRWLPLLFSLLVLGCQAYRAQPEANVLFTRDDLAKKGFVLAPMAVADKSLDPGPAELLAYDIILGNTLRERWPKAAMLDSTEIAKTLDADAVEAWRRAIEKEGGAEASPSSLKVMSELTRRGRSYPKQVLLPTLLQNSVSCGQKEALSTQLSPEPHGVKAYCQRLVKMRFRIIAVEDGQLLWNGLIYATQETSSDIGNVERQSADSEARELEAPTTQALIRDCFRNFSRQFNER